MRTILRTAALGVGLVSLLVACQKVPYTGRKQLNLVPDAVMNALGKATYQSMIGGRAVARGENHQVLERVGRRIAGAANQPDYDWQFTLIRDDTQNAWALPGGYIGVYTGILPVLNNEAGMAFVMGHEVGHATANHGAERLSQQLAIIGGLTAVDLYLSNQSKLSNDQRRMIVAALGLGAEIGVLLPFSRTHEAEADVIGLMYMAKAGYPPAESIAVWERFDRMGRGYDVPAFLATHPSNERRIENLREWLPQARKRYERNKLPGDMRAPLWGGDPRDDRRQSQRQR